MSAGLGGGLGGDRYKIVVLSIKGERKYYKLLKEQSPTFGHGIRPEGTNGVDRM